MWELVPAIATLVACLAAYLTLIGPEGRERFGNFLKNKIHGLFVVAAGLFTELGPELDPLIKAATGAVNRYGPDLHDNLKPFFEAIARTAFTNVTDPVLAKSPAPPAEWVTAASDAMATAFGAGFASFGVTAAFESIFPEKLNVLNGAGPMLATLAGFAEVTGAALGPILHAAIATPATYDANNKLRPNLPDAGRALELLVRRLIDVGDADELLGFAGLPTKWIPAMKLASYRPIRPQILARLIGDQPPDKAKLTEVMRFIGMRDKDIETTIEAFEAAAEKPYRTAYLNAVIESASAGFRTDIEVNDAISQLDLTDTIRNLVLEHISENRHRNLVKGAIAEYLSAVKGGTMTLVEYQDNLIGLGLRQEEITVHVNTASTYIQNTELRAQARLDAKIAAETRASTTAAAVENFRHGNIDQPGLLAAFLAAGYDGAVAAALTAANAAKTQPTVRPGTILSQKAQQQADQKAQIKAAMEEYKKGFLDDPTLLNVLAANGVTPAEANSTLAYLIALRTKATPAAALPA